MHRYGPLWANWSAKVLRKQVSKALVHTVFEPQVLKNEVPGPSGAIARSRCEQARSLGQRLSLKRLDLERPYQ